MSLPSFGTIRPWRWRGRTIPGRPTVAIGGSGAPQSREARPAEPPYIAGQHVARVDLIDVLSEHQPPLRCKSATSVVSLQHIAAIFRAVLCYRRRGAQNDFQSCWAEAD